MKKQTLLISLLALIMAMVAISCNKDNEEETENYMSGFATFKIPQYLTILQDFELEAYGISSPETGISYEWKAEGFTPDSVQGENVVFVAPLEFGSYSVTLFAKHPDYVSTTATRDVEVIDPLNPNSFSGVILGDDYIIDDRDGNKYYYKRYGNLDWFISNLKWDGAGKPYDSTSALNEVYGTLYSWNEATGGIAAQGLDGGPQGACPQGWSVPTREDWEDFAYAIAGEPISFEDSWSGIGEMVATNAKINGSSLWRYSPDNEKENSVGWNALPGGNSANYFKSFDNVGNFGFWWSSSQNSSENGEYRYIHYNSSNFPYNYANKDFFAASVRCVRVALD